jgi:ArsR family transcriptional regulator
MSGNDFSVVECEELAQKLKVLGHPIRMKIAIGLFDGRCNVKSMWECLGLPQATVSQHLHVLKSQGIIKGTRNANEIHYTLADDFIKNIVILLKKHCMNVK